MLRRFFLFIMLGCACSSQKTEETPPRLPPVLKPLVKPLEKDPEPQVSTVKKPAPTVATAQFIPPQECISAITAIIMCFNLPLQKSSTLQKLCNEQILLKQPKLRYLIQCAVDYRNDCTRMRTCLANQHKVKASP